jgi:hypothetical protein
MKGIEPKLSSKDSLHWKVKFLNTITMKQVYALQISPIMSPMPHVASTPVTVHAVITVSKCHTGTMNN